MRRHLALRAFFCLILFSGLVLGTWSGVHADDFEVVKICSKPGFLSEICDFGAWEVTITYVCGSVCSTESQVGCSATCVKSIPPCTAVSPECGPALGAQ